MVRQRGEGQSGDRSTMSQGTGEDDSERGRRADRVGRGGSVARLICAIAGLFRRRTGTADTSQGKESSAAPPADEKNSAKESPSAASRLKRPLLMLGILSLVALAATAVCLFRTEETDPAAGEPTGVEEAGALSPALDGPPMKMAKKARRAGRHAQAARLYELAVTAAERADRPAEALLARHRRSRALLAAGRHERALEAARSLQSISRPGDALWKHATLTCAMVHRQLGQWDELLRALYLLLANWRRYDGGPALAKWARYHLALARVQTLLERTIGKGLPYGLEAPELGRSAPAIEEMTAADILNIPRGEAPKTLQVTLAGDRLRLTSDGAPLARVLKAMGQKTAAKYQLHTSGERSVYARLEDVPPRSAVELVLGSVGLGVEANGSHRKVKPLRLHSVSPDRLARQAIVGLHKFLIRYPGSEQAAEAYFALACVYLVHGQKRLGLEQLQMLTEKFSGPNWNGAAHYLAGRIQGELGNLTRAETDMSLAVGALNEGSLWAISLLWQGHYRVEQGDHRGALECFSRALKGSLSPALQARALYEMGLCAERAGARPRQAERRYLEASMRFPGTRWGDLAAYRLARLSFSAGRYATAVRRYEQYLSTHRLETERAEDACRELLRAYRETGQSVHAMGLGELLRTSFRGRKRSAQVLSLLLDVCEATDMQRTGLRILRQHLEEAGPSARASLLLRRASLLVELERYGEARKVVDRVSDLTNGADAIHRARLIEARILHRAGSHERAIQMCRKTALDSRIQLVRKTALELMGRCFESRGQFGWAARAYAGECPATSAEEQW